MAYRQEEYVSEIVHESGVLKGRTPWKRTPRSDMREMLEETSDLLVDHSMD